VNETETGGDEATADGVDDQETVNDSADLGETTRIHTAVTDDGATTVDVDQQVDGPISLGGGENDSDSTNPNDTDTDVGSGTLSGPVSGDIRQTGTVNGGLRLPAPAGG